MERDPLAATGSFRQAECLFRAGQYSEALRLLTDLDRQFPNTGTILFAKAACLEKLSRYCEADQICNGLMALSPNSRVVDLKARISAMRDAPGLAAPARTKVPPLHTGADSKSSNRRRLFIGGSLVASVLFFLSLPLFLNFAHSVPARKVDILTNSSQAVPGAMPTAGEPQVFAGITFVWIPRGSFVMGSTEGFESEKPVHRVMLENGFWLGRFEVTQAQWRAVAGTNPSHFTDGGNFPVEMVSWDDCQDFIHKLNSSGVGVFRLPSEAEWEYACRAGSTTEYYFGDDESLLGNYAWHGGNGKRMTHPVGEKMPNTWGLYDMLGNVFEWCQDSWHDSYTSAPADGSAWEVPRERSRVLRGGSSSLPPGVCRSADREGLTPGYRHEFAGFRLLRNP